MLHYVIVLCMVPSGSVMLPLTKAIQICYCRVCVKLHIQPPAAAIGRKVVLWRRIPGTMSLSEHYPLWLKYQKLVKTVPHFSMQTSNLHNCFSWIPHFIQCDTLRCPKMNGTSCTPTISELYISLQHVESK